MRDAVYAPVKPVHVLHVLEATGGGTMRYMENIAEATAGINMTFGFAYGVSRADSKLAPFLDRIKKSGWQMFPVDMRREINFSSDFLAFRQLRKVIREFAPDILHCHSSKAGALGRIAGALQSVRPLRLYSPHALAAPLGSKYLRIEKFLSRYTERFIAVSRSERQEIIDLLSVKPDCVDTIYPSIDFGHFQPASKSKARQNLGLGSQPIVLAIGRVTPQKDPESFIAIMKRLHAKRPDARGIWVGSGDAGKGFLELVDAAGLKGVISVVAWQHDVRDYIAAADVFLSTSTFESFGYVTAEALAMHLPVVASDVTGTRDVLRDELREWLYDRGDHEHASELIVRLLDDPDDAHDVAVRGRKIMVKSFNNERMRESLIASYSSALSDVGRKLTIPAFNTVTASVEFVGGGRPRGDLSVRADKS
jgi:glycosyltransferase involved in cell wall biosynthesis